MDALTIEPMRERHLDAVLAIERRLFPTPWTEGMFRQEIADNVLSRSAVAVHDGVVVGYLVAWFVHDEAHLLNVAVDPDHQRRGFGRRLVADLIARARAEQRTLVTLEVRVGNASARRLYESFGFVAAGRRRRYYRDTGEDAHVMLLDLSDEGSRREGEP
jgi:ribosomal-protein-alanine N-acetyltransferase